MARNVNTDIYDSVVDRSAMSRLYENRVTNNLTKDIESHSRKVTDLVKSEKEGFKQGFFNKLGSLYKSTYGNIVSNVRRNLVDFAVDELDHSYNLLNRKVSRFYEAKRPTRRVAEELVLKRPLYKDSTLVSGWNSVSLRERKAIEAVIRKGIAEGLTPAQIATNIRKSSAFQISKNQAAGLVRTSITSIHSQADQQVYALNKDVLYGYQYVAVLDSRTTPLCASRDGKIYPVDDTDHLPPAHWNCRSTTVPVVKSYDDLLQVESIGRIRKNNLKGLSRKEIAQYDGQTPHATSYDTWLREQPEDVQLKHIGDSKKLELFQSRQLTLERFQENGRELSLKELRQQTTTGYGTPGEVRKFGDAKERLEAINLGATSPEDFLNDKELQKNLREYYKLQAGDLDGTLSLVNYRGNLIHTKKARKQSILTRPPTEKELIFNPFTGTYQDTRLYQPNFAVYENNLRLVRESEDLKEDDKKFIMDFVESLEMDMSVNQRAVIADNLRITFSRYRKEKQPWGNFKAVVNNQMKFDVMNTSDFIETQLRKDSNVFNKLKQDGFIDPVLGSVDLKKVGDKLIDNIQKSQTWENRNLPRIGRKLRDTIDYKFPPRIWLRLDEADKVQFYEKFAKRLSLADFPDHDQFAVALGRDLYNAANLRGNRNDWHKLGSDLLKSAENKGFFKLETYGVQKRRMKSKMGNHYFGPYYDTFTTNIRVTEPSILEQAKRVREIEVGMRIPVTDPKKRLYVREGFKTYFDYKNRDTKIPITSTSSFANFPEKLIDKKMADALNWAGQSKFKVDKDFNTAMTKILNFQDDKGKAKYYENLNQYKKYISERGDSYERFKAMEYLVKNDLEFTNNPFLDHRGRIYDRGFISAQSGETFRPFLNTAEEKPLGVDGFRHLQDHVGSFLGGLSDNLEGRFNSLSVIGRQQIAERWRPEMVKIGNHMLRGKPNDIRAILDSKLLAEIDGEEQGKFLRFSMEMAKIDRHLESDFKEANLVKLKDYKTGLALEQDASSSGAQIIALTTRNKELANLSNVVPTTQKKRLYDEIANSTYNDPRFIELNKKLGLSEKDLRKAAKAQNMVNKSSHIKIPLIAGNLFYSCGDNQQPSLDGDILEGSTTKTYELYEFMKSVRLKRV